MTTSADLDPDQCPQCGRRLHHGSHTDEAHAVFRRRMMHRVRYVLREELKYRREADDAARKWGCVMTYWWVPVSPYIRKQFSKPVAFETWDDVDRGELLAFMGRDLRGYVEEHYGHRPHFMQTKYRVFDGRSRESC